VRIYERNGKKYLSVTSLVDLRYPFESVGFEQWAWSHGFDPLWITKESGKLGERYHAYAENRHYGIGWADVVETDKDRKYLEAVNKFFEDGWEILSSEVEVYNESFRYAGRFDMILKNDKLKIKRALGDFKTYGAWKGGKYKRDAKKLEKLSMQLTLYEEALGEKLPKVGVILGGDGKYNLEDIPVDDSVWEWLEENKEVIDKLIKDNDVSRR